MTIFKNNILTKVINLSIRFVLNFYYYYYYYYKKTTR